MSANEVVLSAQALAKQELNGMKFDAEHRDVHMPGDELSYPAQITKEGEPPFIYRAVHKGVAARQNPASFGKTTSGFNKPHPNWDKLHPEADAKPNRHGHVLLRDYTMNANAKGLGYGTKNKNYYQYLSIYNQVKTDEAPPEEEKTKDFKAKPCPSQFATGLGYGPPHANHHAYVAPRTILDV